MYCSEACRLQDCTDASASNSSVAPSSASASPSRLGLSPRFSPKTTARPRASAGSSSHTSSPSFITSDLGEDRDVQIITEANRLYNANAPNVLNHSFWQSRASNAKARPGGVRADHQSQHAGSKSVPGHATTLHYVRKPGPVNSYQLPGIARNTGTTSSRTHGQILGSSKKRSPQGSAGSASSSTPRSKSLAVHASNGTLKSQPYSPRHVSDSVVHSLRQSGDTLGNNTRNRHSLMDSLALTALKDVARTHGVQPPNEFETIKGPAEYSRRSGRESMHEKTRSQDEQIYSPSIQSTLSTPSLLPGGSRASQESTSSSVDEQSDEERGRRRTRRVSRSPSPPPWTSWEAEEPLQSRRGRSARRG